MSGAPVSDLELSAWLDGEVASDRGEAIAKWLRTTPAAVARVDGWRRQNEILRTRFLRVANEPPPESVWPAQPAEERPEPAKTIKIVADRDAPILAAQGFRSGRAHRARLTLVALVSCAFGACITVATLGAVGGFSGWWSNLRGAAVRPVEAWALESHRVALAERAAEANVAFVRDSIAPVDIWADDIAKLGDFLSRRVGLVVAPPVFDGQGPRLLGGRIAPGENGPAALLVYEELAGDRFGLLMTRAPADGTDGPRIVERRSSAVAVWFARGTAFALVGPRDPARLSRFAAALEARAPAAALREP